MTQLVVVPSARRLPADGLSSSMLTIATLDEFGYPVSGVPVDLRLELGDGSVPVSATTNSSGVAVVYYTAGRKNGLTVIDVSAAGLSAGVSILQAPAEMSFPELPISAAAATRSVVEDWASGLTALRVERE
jgi:hypothetical protein